MPPKGYKPVTITEEVYEEIDKQMKELNRKAGFRKYRSKSQFVEEAVMGYVINVIQKGAIDPETLVKNLVEVLWDRYEILGSILNRLVALPPEEALHRMEMMLGPEDLDKLKVICMKLIELHA